jgi:hypothetical protein
MMPARLALLGLLALSACASAPRSAGARGPRHRAASAQWHEEASYGFTWDNPIRIGGGPEGESIFFEVLRGPEGQPVAWRRVGACCAFETSQGPEGLEVYEVIYEGMEQPITLYLDVHHAEPVFAPRGFSISFQEQEQEQEELPPHRPEVIEL